MVKKNSIPERWRSLTAVGQRVPGSRFIAFKVPLKGVANQRVTQNQKFTPKDLLTTIRSLNEELGLIIDLTNTERYYTTKDLPKSVQYVKLHTAGLKIPDDATIHQFKRVVWKFLAANSDNDKLIGVHCTTGINRTGFLICRYLIDVDEWKPLHALSVFSQSRGHPIEGTVYIEDILKGPPRSNAGIDTPPTIDEPRPEDDGYYGTSDGLPRDRRQREDSLRSLLELVPGNEYADFDARGSRPLPLMRTRSDEYRDDRREFMNRRPEVRGGRPPPGDMSDDVDLRSPFERRNVPSNMPEHMNAPERFRRPDDFNPDERFDPRLENRQDFHGSETRPVMGVRENYGPRDMQRPRGMPHEQMDYDDRMRGRQSPVQDFYEEPSSHHGGAEYDDIESARRMRSVNSDVEFRERLRRQEFQSMENENHGFDPRVREMTTGSLNEKILPRNTRTLEALIKDRINARNTQLLGEPMNEVAHLRDRQDMDGPIQGRMHPRDARTLEGRMNDRLNARNTQLLGEPMNETTHPRDRRDMEGPIREGIYPRDARTLEGRMNDRINVRNTQFLGEAMNEIMHPRERQNLEAPIHERMHPRDARFMEGSVNERYTQMDAQGNRNVMDERMHLQNVRPMNERVQSRDSQFMEGQMNNQMYSSDARQIEASTHERIQARGARFMDPPLNERFNPRDGQAMENSMSDRIPPRDSRTLNRSMNERMTPRDPKSMEEPLNARMQPRMDRPVEGTMNPQMHSREGLVNERVPLRDTRAVEGRMNEQMYQRNVRTMQGPMNEKMFPRDPRTMEGSINERMYHQVAEMPMNKERDFMTNTRPFEGRKINPSEDALRGANRFAPYPSIMKPGQPAEISRGMPRPDARDPRAMLPSSQDATGFPLRNRFN